MCDGFLIVMMKMKKYDYVPIGTGGVETIWLITCLDCQQGLVKSTRTFGWKSSEAEAVSAVLENRGDIFEVYYNYAVVEEVRSGIHGSILSEIWFKWDAPPDIIYGPNFQSRWTNIDKPEWSRNIMNWGIG